MTPQELIDELNRLPSEIYTTDMDLCKSGAHLSELKDSLELAELNAELGIVLPEKSNEDTRKKLRAEAIAKSPDVRSIKRQILDEQFRQSEREAARSLSLRKFQATMLISELSAAQLNVLAARVERGLVSNGH